MAVNSAPEEGNKEGNKDEDFATDDHRADFGCYHDNNNDVTWENDAMESLQIQIERLRLEEQNTRRFLKAKPAKLSYEQCKKWAQHQNMFDTKEEWFEYINTGENLCSYVPSDPETYYKDKGTWISWNDFLGTTF